MEALGFPVGRQANQTQLGMSPSSQLLALYAMLVGGLWLAGKAAPVSRQTRVLGSPSGKGARIKKQLRLGELIKGRSYQRGCQGPAGDRKSVV